MPQDFKTLLLTWLKTHPGIFYFIEENQSIQILESFSQKQLKLPFSFIHRAEIKNNALNPQEDYLVLLFENQTQVVLCAQGFAFAPDFSNSGILDLPNPVYCFQDYHAILNRLEHVAAEEGRGAEALQLILILIAILDGAKRVGLETGSEEAKVEKILQEIEKGKLLPSPHES